MIVVGLGTNGTVTTSQIRQLLATIGPHHTLVLINTFDPRPWQNGDNRVLAAAARTHDNVALADWFATIEHRTGLALGRRCESPPASGYAVCAHGGNGGAGYPQPRPTTSPWPATCHIP